MSLAKYPAFVRVTDKNAREIEVHKFHADASDLGLPPGSFPEFLDTNLGNGNCFIRSNLFETHTTYRQELGCITLTVWND